MTDLPDRIARIRGDWDIPAWVSEGAPPNPRAPTVTDDRVDFDTMWAEREAAYSEVAQLRFRVEALTRLASVLHDELECVPPCAHLGLLDELALG